MDQIAARAVAGIRRLLLHVVTGIVWRLTLLRRRIHERYATYRDRERVVMCRYRDRPFYYPERSDIGARIARGEAWDAVLEPILASLFADERIVIAEVGSNIGASLMHIKLAKPQAVVFCFEPSTRFLPVLQRNVRANRWRDVVVEPVALGRSEGRQELFTNTSTASVVADDYDGHDFLSSQSVETRTLDGYFADAQRLDLIKVDTDGFDFDVLLGGIDVLTRLRPVLYFEFQQSLLTAAAVQPTTFLRYLAGVGYRQALLLSNYGEALGVTTSEEQTMAMADGQLYLDVLTVHGDGEQQRMQLEELRRTIGSRYGLARG